MDLAVRYLLPATLTEQIQQELTSALRDVLGAGAPAVWVRIADVEPQRTT